MRYKDPVEEERWRQRLREQVPTVYSDQCWSCNYPEKVLHIGMETTCLSCGAQKLLGGRHETIRKSHWNSPGAAERIVVACRMAIRRGCRDARVLEIVKEYGAKFPPSQQELRDLSEV